MQTLGYSINMSDISFSNLDSTDSSHPARPLSRAKRRRNEEAKAPQLPLFLPQISLESSLKAEDQFLESLQYLPFSARVLAWALQNRLTIQAIQRYALSYASEDVKAAIDRHVEGYQALFYAIQRNEVSAVSLILKCSANPNARSEQEKIPVLGYAIFHAECQVINTVEVVKILLAMGANPKVIPQDMWEDYVEMPKAVINRNEEVKNLASSWCTPESRTVIARNLSISHRYFLNKANQLKPPKARVKQVAAIHNISLLLTIPYLIVGQSIGTSLALSRLFGHFALNKKKPLVMVFTGPSGHGKTELAHQMKNLLSCSAFVVDCPAMHCEMDLFGWKGAYHSRDEGAPLNNFLGEHSGQRCIVFLDELEKTTDDVRQALLLVFDTGGGPLFHSIRCRCPGI